MGHTPVRSVEAEENCAGRGGCLSSEHGKPSTDRVAVAGLQEGQTVAGWAARAVVGVAFGQLVLLSSSPMGRRMVDRRVG